MAQATFKVRPIAGAIGAEIYGVDLAGELGAHTVAALRRAWLQHRVIFFRAQPLPPAQFLTFAQRFGAIVEYPFITGIEGFPEIIPVVKLEPEKTAPHEAGVHLSVSLGGRLDRFLGQPLHPAQSRQ
jgi:taurine dioxygenase